MQIGERIDRIARRMKAARAGKRGGDVRFPATARSERGASWLPHRVVDDRSQPYPVPCLDHGPCAPARDAATTGANSLADVHRRAFVARRTSAGWITSSTSPYETASSGAMK
jgi:hypothetical protein